MSTQGARRSGDDGAAAGAGDTRAAEALRVHGACVGRVCMALLGDPAEVERALEDVARQAGSIDAGAIAAGSGEAAALEYLLTLARAACATRLSKVPLGRATSPRLTATGPAEARAALGRLRPTEREAVVLVTVGGLDVAAAARVCGIDLETARGRIARGLSQLTKEKTT
ncbi:MAG: hypothetical protein JWP97_6758 [Labilithrix sp.]|nr:hypothetical protein [Labilithrix sp.]